MMRKVIFGFKARFRHVAAIMSLVFILAGCKHVDDDRTPPAGLTSNTYTQGHGALTH